MSDILFDACSNQEEEGFFFLVCIERPEPDRNYTAMGSRAAPPLYLKRFHPSFMWCVEKKKEKLFFFHALKETRSFADGTNYARVYVYVHCP